MAVHGGISGHGRGGHVRRLWRAGAWVHVSTRVPGVRRGHGRAVRAVWHVLGLLRVRALPGVRAAGRVTGAVRPVLGLLRVPGVQPV